MCQTLTTWRSRTTRRMRWAFQCIAFDSNAALSGEMLFRSFHSIVAHPYAAGMDGGRASTQQLVRLKEPQGSCHHPPTRSAFGSDCPPTRARQDALIHMSLGRAAQAALRNNDVKKPSSPSLSLC